MNWIRRTYQRFRQSQIFSAQRSTVDENRPPTGLQVFEFNTQDNVNAERIFKRITEEDLYDYPTTKLIETLCVSNGTAARLWDDFVMFGTLDYTLTCESARGQMLLDKFRETLDNKRNSFEYNLRQIFSQIILRGNYCFEIILDENRMFSNLATPDPDYFRFQSREDPNDGTVWELAQWDEQGEPIVIDSPFVHFEALNALPGRRKGTALIAPAMPSIISNLLMMQDLRKVVKTHAFMEKFWSINYIELKKAGYTFDQVKEIVDKSKEEIRKVAANRDKSLVPVVSAEMDLKQYSGAGADGGQGLGFVETVQQVNDNETMRGGMTTPPNLGIQNYQAESSMSGLARRDALRIESYQDDVEQSLSAKLTLGLRAQGVRAPAVLKLKRNNALILLTETEIANQYSQAVGHLVTSGIPADLALMMTETITQIRITDKLKADIKERMHESMDAPTETE